MAKFNLLASPKYAYLKETILQNSDCFNDIAIETKTFPDGEHYWKIENPQKIAGKPAVYVCGTTDDATIFEAFNICCTLVREGCTELHLVLPYFGYSTMERAVKEGEVVTAKNIATMFSSIPEAPLGNFVYMLDLHSLGTQYYFESTIHPVHLTSWNIIRQMISECSKNAVLASSDMGRAKWIERMAMELHLESAYIMKKRISGSRTKVVALNADVENKDIVIFDDMIRSGSSIINAAKAYKDAGANDIYITTVHGVFVDGSIEKIKQSGVIKGICCTNSHSNTTALNDDFVKVYDISPVIINGLLRK